MRRLLTAALALLGLALTATAAQAEAVLTRAELAAATQQAEAAGSVESIEASGGSQKAVETAFAPGEPELTVPNSIKRPSASLDLVVMRGHFEDVMAKTPVGAPAPTGTVMSFVLNRETGRVAAVSVGNVAPTPAPGAIIERPVLTQSLTAQSASFRRSRRPSTCGNLGQQLQIRESLPLLYRSCLEYERC